MAVSFRDLLKPAAVDDVEAAKRRQALAEAMYAKNMGPNLPQIGGPVQQKYGVGNALVDLANSLASAYNLKQANEGMRTAQDARNANIGEAMYQLQNSVPDDLVGAAAAARIKNTPDGQLAAPVYAESDAQRRMAASLGPDGLKALAEAMLAQSMKRSDPELQANLGLKQATLLASQQNHQDALAQRRAEMEARVEMLKEQIASREQMGRDAADLRRELAAQQASLQRELEAGRSSDRRYQADLAHQDRLAKIEADKAKAPHMTSAESATGFLQNAEYDPATGQDAITKLLGQASGGALQSWRDAAGRAFNYTTDGAAANAALKSRASEAVLDFLGGKLGAGVSNADRDFMMQRAGDIGNEKLSTGERLKAWLDVRGRMEAAAGARSGTAPAAAPAASPAAPAAPAAAPSADGWRTMPNGVRIREKP